MSGLTPPFPSVEDVPSSPANLEDRGSEPRTPFAAASPVTPSPRTGSSQSTSAHDWESFPWSQFPDLTISEWKGRPKSWIWQHGYDLQEIKDETRHRWVCRECVKKKDPKITAHLASATIDIESHLGNQHNIHGGKLQPRLGKRTIDQMFSLASTEMPDVGCQFRNRLKKQFDKAVFQRKLVRWIVETNQSFRVSESGTFRDLLDYLNPIISATNAHISHDAIRRRVADEYHIFRLHIVRALRQSPSAVHIAFDGWTSRNRVIIVLLCNYRARAMMRYVRNMVIYCLVYYLTHWLIGHLEEAKLDADRTPEPAHFMTNINLAWAKLNKYYSTIDQSPAYYAATVLHPAIRWDFLRRAYRERPEWIEKA
ncbi:hypothetical protein ACQRIU_006979 [Beauveria bassiana]